MRFAAVMSASLLALTTLAGCDDDVAPPQTDLTDELAAHDGHPCPRRLAASDDGHGFGTDDPADERPTLLPLDEAWVCRYDARGTTEGTSYAWRLTAGPRPVPQELLSSLTDQLGELEPAEDERACTSELGPRWLLVLSHDGDLTGVAVDDFGCEDVRLTDDPYRTAPGDPGQQGTVAGVLAAPHELLDALTTD